MVMEHAKTLKELDTADVNRALIQALRSGKPSENQGLKIKVLAVLVLELQAGIKDQQSIADLLTYLSEGSLLSSSLRE